MNNQPLNLITLLQHAARKYPVQEIVSRRLEGDIHRTNYQTLYLRSAQLANALTALGMGKNDCIASLAWNGYRHMELYYAVTGIGATMHTINPRLFSEQISYIVNHAQDSWLFVDVGFEGIVDAIIKDCPSVKGVVFMCDPAVMPDSKASLVLNYEALLTKQAITYPWPTLPEHHACMLCYTSGTTGDPKGVLYSHRAMVLHAWASINAETLNLDEESVILPMVAMYHAQAWGLPFSAPIVGAKLVLPGSGMDGETIFQLLESEQVNLAFGVPTIWLLLHQYLEQTGQTPSTLKRIGVGGAASPVDLIKTYDQRYGIYWQSLWGMTETGPLATSTTLTKAMKTMDREQRYQLQAGAGRPIFGVEIALFDEDDQPLPHDGKTAGELRIRGPYIINQYYRNPDLSAFPDGWLATGDIATISADDYLIIVDRKKDVIKSGGEWISSLELENIVTQHPKVAEACVIGCQHKKWDERPVLLVVAQPECKIDRQSIYQFLEGKIAKWWTPDAIIEVEHLPKNATGKVTKVSLREHYKNILLEPNHD